MDMYGQRRYKDGIDSKMVVILMPDNYVNSITVSGIRYLLAALSHTGLGYCDDSPILLLEMSPFHTTDCFTGMKLLELPDLGSVDEE